MRYGKPAVENNNACRNPAFYGFLSKFDSQIVHGCPGQLADPVGKSASIDVIPDLSSDLFIIGRCKQRIPDWYSGYPIGPRKSQDPVSIFIPHGHMVEIFGNKFHSFSALWQRGIINDKRISVILVVSKSNDITDNDRRQPQEKSMSVHMNVFQKPIDSVFGKIFMESSNFHLIVHAHRREHEIEDVEQDDFYGDSFFLIGPTFSEKLYTSKAV